MRTCLFYVQRDSKGPAIPVYGVARGGAPMFLIHDGERWLWEPVHDFAPVPEPNYRTAPVIPH